MNMFEVYISKDMYGYNAKCDALDLAVYDQPDRESAIEEIRENIASVKAHLDTESHLIDGRK